MLIRRKVTRKDENGQRKVNRILQHTTDFIRARACCFSNTREDASKEVLERAKKTGVIQKVNGEWRIVSVKKKKLWNAHYKTKEKAQAALRGYQANK